MLQLPSRCEYVHRVPSAALLLVACPHRPIGYRIPTLLLHHHSIGRHHTVSVRHLYLPGEGCLVRRPVVDRAIRRGLLLPTPLRRASISRLGDRVVRDQHMPRLHRHRNLVPPFPCPATPPPRPPGLPPPP